jgi:flagellar protein FlgJ
MKKTPAQNFYKNSQKYNLLKLLLISCFLFGVQSMAIGKIEKANFKVPSAQRERVENARAEQITPRTPERPRNAKVDEVAKLYEKQFLREMVKAMRGSSDMGYIKPGMGEKIYREELDNQYVEAWGDQGGVGMQNIIYDQMMERYFDNAPGMKGLRPPGGIKLTDKDVSRVVAMPTQQKAQMPLKIELQKNVDGTPTHVQLPFDAKFISQNKMLDGKTAVTLEHSGGFRSTFIFDGVFLSPEKNSELKQGTSLATLSPEIKSFFWNLTGPQESVKPAVQPLVQPLVPDQDNSL